MIGHAIGVQSWAGRGFVMLATSSRPSLGTVPSQIRIILFLRTRNWNTSTILTDWLTYLLTYLLNYLLTYILTSWSRVLLEKLTGLQLVKKFPAFYGNRRFITALTSVRHLSLFWARSKHSMPPQSSSWRSILIVSSRLRLGLPSGHFPSGFPTKILYTPLLSPKRATCPAHIINTLSYLVIFILLV